jgi:hypothetical protein
VSKNRGQVSLLRLTSSIVQSPRNGRGVGRASQTIPKDAIPHRKERNELPVWVCQLSEKWGVENRREQMQDPEQKEWKPSAACHEEERSPSRPEVPNRVSLNA